MGLAEQRWLRMFTLCILYVAQGIPFGFMAVTLPAYITERNVPNEALASALVMTTLPYTFKWIWGPVIDLVTIPALGRRRPWVMFAQLMMTATVLAMLAIPDVTRDLELLGWFIFVHAIFNSMQDVAVDALAIDLLDEDERGRANGLMYACKYGGVIVGGAGLGNVLAAYDLTTALMVQSGILFAIFTVPLVVRERTGPPPPPPRVREVVAGLAQVASLRSTLVLAIMMLGITLSSGVLAIASYPLYITKLHWSAETYTDLAGGLAYITGFGGSLLGGFLADIVGRKRLVALASIGLAAGWFLFGLSPSLWGNTQVIVAFAIWGALCQSMMIVGSFALCMDASWARVAATQFATFMALQAMSTTLGYKLGPLAIAKLGYEHLFLAAGLAQFAITGLLFAIDPRAVHRRLDAGARFGAIGILTIALVVIAIGVVPVLLLVL